MKYTDEECKKYLERQNDRLELYCLIDIYEGADNYSVNLIRDGLIYNYLIEDNDLFLGCIDFLIRNGNPVYRDIDEFKEKNPAIIC